MTPGPHSRPDGGGGATNEHEQLIDRLLNDPAKQEALQWLKACGVAEKRAIGCFESAEESIQFVQQIYDFGAVLIVAVQIRPAAKGTGQRTGKLVVELPKDSRARRAIFDWCKAQGHRLGFSPNPDKGETHLFLLLD